MRSFDELAARLVGSWDIEGVHPLLPREAVLGRATFERLDGRALLIWRAHYDHPQVPDAIIVMGWIDDELLMHYFDVRGVHRLYLVAVEGDTWRYWRDDPAFRQSVVVTLDPGGDTMTGRGRMNRDDAGWEDDLTLAYRRHRS